MKFNAKFKIKKQDAIKAVFTLYLKPNKVSQLENDLHFQTDEEVAASIEDHNQSQEAHPYIQTIINNNYNTLDEKINSVNSELSQRIQTEEETRLENDIILQDNIESETASRIEEDSILADSISALDTKYESITGALDDKIDSVNGALSDSISALDTKYESITGALDDKIDSINGALSDSISALDTKYESITGALSDSITGLDTKYDSITGALDDKIDSVNGALSDSISALDSVVSSNYNTLNNKIDSVQGALADSISALSDTVINNYNTLDSKIDSVTGALDTKYESITGALSDDISDEATARQNADDSIIGSIEALSSIVSSNYTTLDNKIDSVNGALNDKIDSVNGALSDDIDVLESVISANYNTLNNKIDSVNGALNDKIDSVNGALGDSIATLDSIVSSNYTTLDDKIDSINGALSDSITGLDTKYDSITGALSDSITGLDTKYDSITGALDTKYDSITGALSDSITGLDTKYDSITGALSDSISALDTKYDSITGALDDKIDSINGALSDSITDLDTKYDSITGALDDKIDAHIADKANPHEVTASQVGLGNVDNTSDLNKPISTAMQTALDTKQPTITGAATSITSNNLTSSRALISDTNGKVAVSDITSTELNALDSISGNIQAQFNNITDLIPSEATTTNQLADKDFVNSSIATNTANPIGTFSSVSALEAYTGTVTNNDYAFVTNSTVTDNGNDWATFAALDAYNKDLLTNWDYAWVINGTKFDLYRFDIINQAWDLRVSNTDKADVTLNSAYNRYKANVSGTTITWVYEYTLNNSSFTAAQWLAINSGITSATKVTHTANTAIGDANTPVYINASGAATPLSYTIAKSVPSNAEFTDTTYIFATGTANGTISVTEEGGTAQDIAVKGLGSAAYTASTAYATSAQGTKADTAIQPNDNISRLTNDSGYITGINSSDVTTALGYTPYNSTNPNGYITGINSSDVTTALGYTPYNSTNPNGYISGINSSDVTTALGYTPYNSTNPNGYISGIDSTMVTTALGYTPYDSSNPNDYLTSSDLPTNHVTTDTDQNITGTKTFVGQKKIGFKQSGSSDKLGFTLYNNSGTEKGYLEYNPSNTVDSVPLMTLGNYASSSAGLTHVGFRKYSSISGASGAYNLLAPLISDARTPFNLTTSYTNFYLPLGFTNGTTTVLTAKTGLVNISTLLPSLAGYATESWVTSKGYITGISSSDVTTALGYTPYDSSNPNGYTSNTGTVTSVNNVSPINGNVSLTIPTVGNGTITINQGGVQKGTFTTNQSGNTTIDLDAGGTIIENPLSFSKVDGSSTYTYTVGFNANNRYYTQISVNDGTTTTNTQIPSSYTIANGGALSISTSTASSNPLETTKTFTVGVNVDDSTIKINNDGQLYFNNSAGYISGITSSMVTTALGYTPYNSTNPSGYQANVIETIKVNNVAQTVTSKTVNITVPSEVTETTVSGWGFTKNVGTVTSVNNVSPVNGNVTLSIPTVNNATLTIQKNGTTVKTFTANASTNVTANITVPTKTSDLTNDSSFITGITSSMVTTALGYTPYNSTNPNGYQANVIETIKVNGTAQTITSKAVDISVPTKVSQLTNDSGYTSNVGTVTSVNNVSPVNGNVSLTIPTVNNATLTIQKNGTTVKTFTANASSNVTANITVPTKVSELTNDSGYTTNTGTVTSVNNVSPVNGNVSLTIPTVNNATLTIQKNGTTVKTFTANASSNVTANIEVPNYFAGGNISIDAVEKVTLPSGYTQVAYIEGTGAQYIDTGWKYSATYPIKFDCKFIVNSYNDGSGGYPVVYGLQTASYSNWIYPFYINAGNFNPHIGGSAGIDSVPCALGQVYDTSFTIGNGTWSRTINGTSTSGTWSGSITNTANMFLFGGSYGTNPINQLIGKIFSFKITVNGSVVRNYIPCKRNSDNVAGMYDLATSTFKPSASGNFLMGSEVTASGEMISATVPTKTSQLTNDSGFINTVDQTYNSSSTNPQSGTAIAGAGFLQVKGAITSSTTLTTLEEGIYTVDGVTHSGFPDTSQAFYGVLIQYGGTYKPQLLVAGMPSVGGLYHRRYLTASSSFTGWVRCGNAATGTNSFTMGGTPSSATSSVNVGIASTARGGYSTAIGYYSASNGARSTSIGYGARIGASTADAIQIGNGTNSTAKTLSIGFYNTGNYTLLDGTTGYIPNARINMDSTPTASSTNTVTSGGVYSALSDKISKSEVYFTSSSGTLSFGV